MTPTTKPDGATPELTQEQRRRVHLLQSRVWLADYIDALEAEVRALRQANADMLAADKGRQGVVEALKWNLPLGRSLTLWCWS